MDTEKQRQRRRDDARLTEDGNARGEQLNTRGTYRVANQQSLACLSGSERRSPGWFLDMKYQTCFTVLWIWSGFFLLLSFSVVRKGSHVCVRFSLCFNSVASAGIHWSSCAVSRVCIDCIGLLWAHLTMSCIPLVISCLACFSPTRCTLMASLQDKQCNICQCDTQVQFYDPGWLELPQK